MRLHRPGSVNPEIPSVFIESVTEAHIEEIRSRDRSADWRAVYEEAMQLDADEPASE